MQFREIDIDRIIEMAWEDRTPFDAIELQYNLKENEVRLLERKKRILFLEDLSLRHQQTQLFIETPFRNNHMLEDLCKYCHPNTVLVVATNISTESENITRDTIKNWRKKSLNLNKKPSVFLIHKY